VDVYDKSDFSTVSVSILKKIISETGYPLTSQR
jgi:hypothetical protein